MPRARRARTRGQSALRRWVTSEADFGLQFRSRRYVTTWVRLPYESPAGLAHWLLVRRSLSDPTELALRVRYDSPLGWTTYSPLLRMDFARRANYAWSRR